MEHLRGVDISDDIVYVFLINNDFTDSAFNETLLQFFQRSVIFYSYDFGSGNHAVTNLDTGEVQCVLEYFDFRINLFLILGVLYAALNKMVQVHFRECFGTCFLIYFGSGQSEYDSGYGGSELADGVEYHITDESGYGQHVQCKVRIDLEQCLR